jgi:ankyrin repeat protein
MTTLLQAGAPLTYPDMTPDHALFACFQFCSKTSLMLHLSRLNENGADLNHCDMQGNSSLILAMQMENRALVQMLINSGAALSEKLETEECSKEIIDYAKRLTDDLAIRQIMLS